MKNFLGVQKFVLMRGGGIVSPAMMLVVFSDTVQAKLELHGVGIGILPLVISLVVVVWIIGILDWKLFLGAEKRFEYAHMVGADCTGTGQTSGLDRGREDQIPDRCVVRNRRIGSILLRHHILGFTSGNERMGFPD